MAKVSTALVNYDELNDSSYPTAIRVGSAAWFDWLVNHRSFRFECSHGTFTANKESRKSGMFWYANRRVGGKLRRAYLGASKDLTLDKLVNVANELAGSDLSYWGKKSPTLNPCVTKPSPSEQPSQESTRQLSELQVQLDQERAIASQLREELAHTQTMLKAFENFQVSEVDLTSAKLYKLHNRVVVRLEDLEKAGYKVTHPDWVASSCQVGS